MRATMKHASARGGGEGGIRTHEHPLRCYWNSSPAPSTARPPLQSITYESFLEALCGGRGRLRKTAAHDKACARRPHQACGGGGGFGTLNDGGSSRHGSLALRGRRRRLIERRDVQRVGGVGRVQARGDLQRRRRSFGRHVGLLLVAGVGRAAAVAAAHAAAAAAPQSLSPEVSFIQLNLIYVQTLRPRAPLRAHAGVILRRQRRERQSYPRADEPHLCQRPLDRNRIRLDEQLAMQCAERRIEPFGRRPIPAAAPQPPSPTSRAARRSPSPRSPRARRRRCRRGRWRHRRSAPRNPRRTARQQLAHARDLRHRLLDADDARAPATAARRSPAACRPRCARARYTAASACCAAAAAAAKCRYSPSCVGRL